tara:strand:- start:10822 stop:11421 length:600 start_codon:yes stop_codon:yes gene_type:complete
MTFPRILCACLFILIINTAPSFAENAADLKVSEVGAFLNSTELLEPIADEMKAEGIPTFFEVHAMNMLGTDVPSHLKAVENIKKDHPEYYQKMSDVILNHDYQGVHHYASVEQWAGMADRIMLAFYTSRSDGGGRNFAEMSAKAAPLIKMSKMNPEASKQMQGVLDMLESFSKVTDADRQVVRQFNTQLALHFSTYPQK